MKIKDITRYLETIAPSAYQESYDNSGLLVGSPDDEVEKALICLDSIEEVIDEAIAAGCGLVIAHHPIVFSGLKRFNGKNYIERVVMKAIKNNIAIYAIHTNLDNVLKDGVNAMICEKLGLENTYILAPKKELLRKLVVFCPKDHAEAVRSAMFAAGAGAIGDYDECSFNLDGTGTFRANEGADPFVGNKNEQHHESETRVEVIYHAPAEHAILSAMLEAHPYEEVAHDMYPLLNRSKEVGSGMVGELPEAQDEMAFLTGLKTSLNTDCVRYTALTGSRVKKVAVCGGSGSFLLNAAKSSGADVFITGDFKYHQFFDAEGEIVIADVGHFESEQFTIDQLARLITKKFPKFAVRLTSVNTNPVNYL